MWMVSGSWRDLGRAAKETGEWLRRSAADLFFPPACPACGRMTMSGGALCAACWSQVRFIEKPYCDILGSPFSHDLGEGAVSADAIAHPPDFARLRSACLFDGPARELVHGLKYRDQTELAPMMALWMARAGAELIAASDVLLPVPLHRRRMLERRFNQAAELTRALSAITGAPMLPDAVKRIRNTAHQVGLTRLGRDANVRGAFRLTDTGASQIFGRRILIVDDVYTTGATVSAIARLLTRSGVAGVNVLTFARALPDTI
jgi:ComF family protein